MAKKQKKSEEPSAITPIQIIRSSPVFTTKFKEDLGWWYKNDPKKANKILDMVTAIMSDPFTGIGKSEPLKYLDSDYWSRRIDLEHRLIYIVNKEQIVFLTCRYHYE
jgi:toxin YoeB